MPQAELKEFGLFFLCAAAPSKGRTRGALQKEYFKKAKLNLSLFGGSEMVAPAA
jgi:hypothetical protein